jgi:hypothetical protein
MGYNLFLDDIRYPEDAANYMHPDFNCHYRMKEWVIVRTYKEFVETVKSRGLPDMVSFDHDLADIHYNPKTQVQGFEYQEETGYDCTKWLVDYCMDNNLEFPQYLVHSQNQVGAENISTYIENFKKSK